MEDRHNRSFFASASLRHCYSLHSFAQNGVPAYPQRETFQCCPYWKVWRLARAFEIFRSLPAHSFAGFLEPASPRCNLQPYGAQGVGHDPLWLLHVLSWAVAASEQLEMLSAAVEEEACDSNLHRIAHTESIRLAVASDVLDPARKTFGAWPNGLLAHLRYSVVHASSRGPVVRCRQRVAAEAGVARLATDVTEVEPGYYTVTVRLDTLHVAHAAAEGVQAAADADMAS